MWCKLTTKLSCACWWSRIRMWKVYCHNKNDQLLSNGHHPERYLGPGISPERASATSSMNVLKVSRQKLMKQKRFDSKEEIVAVRTVCSHIEYMIKGITKGLQYKVRAVRSHFNLNWVFSEKQQPG